MTEETPTPNLDEMRAQIAEHDAAEAEQARFAEEAKLAPLRELQESPELQLVKDKLAELRPLYLEDERVFRKLDAAFLALNRL